MMVSGCAIENFDPNKVRFKMFSSSMPLNKILEQNIRLTQSQRMAVISGEQPDWGKDEVISIGYDITW